MPRPTVAEIRRSALLHNWKAIQAKAGSVPLCAIVKGNAYGHGVDGVSKILEEAGCKFWGVHSVAEALELREAGRGGEILVLGGAYPDEVEHLRAQRLTAAIYDLENLQALLSAAGGEPNPPISAHLKLDTGMGRLGVRPEQLEIFLDAYQKQKVFQLTGVFAHLPAAEDERITRGQKNVFEACLSLLRKRGIDPGYCHHSNSMVALSTPDLYYNLLRPGVALYGIYYHSSLRPIVDLKPVMRLVSEIISLRDLPAGVSLSYGYTFTTKRPSRIATIPAGYADGYPRSCGNQATVLVRGKKVPVVGRVCMDMCLIDVTDVPEAVRGDRVILFGETEAGTIPVEDVAAAAGTISYEVLTGISPRVPRRLVEV